MDPATVLGIVTAVGGLRTTASKAAIGCGSLIQKYTDAPLSIALIEDECRMTKAVLSYVQDFLESNADSLARRLAERPNPFSDLVDVALTGSTTTFGMLDGEMRSLQGASALGCDHKSKQRLRLMWNEQHLAGLVERLRTVKSSLNLLLSVLQTQAVHGQLARNAGTVDAVRRSIAEVSLSDSKDIHRRSIFAVSVASDYEFEFDDQIVNTLVYREALRFNTRKQLLAPQTDSTDPELAASKQAMPDLSPVTRSVSPSCARVSLLEAPLKSEDYVRETHDRQPITATLNHSSNGPTRSAPSKQNDTPEQAQNIARPSEHYDISTLRRKLWEEIRGGAVLEGGLQEAPSEERFSSLEWEGPVPNNIIASLKSQLENVATASQVDPSGPEMGKPRPLASRTQSFEPVKKPIALPLQRHQAKPDTAHTERLFQAISMSEFKIEHERQEAGYPYLVYAIGEVFDVLGVKGELWLAVKKDDKFRTVGWIWDKHFAKIRQGDTWTMNEFL